MTDDGKPIITDEEIAPVDCPSPLAVRVLTDQESYIQLQFGRWRGHMRTDGTGLFIVNGKVVGGNK